MCRNYNEFLFRKYKSHMKEKRGCDIIYLKERGIAMAADRGYEM
jgi:hypothetical protein